MTRPMVPSGAVSVRASTATPVRSVARRVQPARGGTVVVIAAEVVGGVERSAPSLARAFRPDLWARGAPEGPGVDAHASRRSAPINGPMAARTATERVSVGWVTAG